MGNDGATYVGKLLSCSWFQVLFSSVAMVVGAWWDRSPEAMKALLIGGSLLFIADFVLGLAKAWWCPEQKISSKKMGGSLVKFVVYSMSFLGAAGLDCALGINAGMQLAIAALIVVREATSCMENSAALGFPWPEWVKERLEGLTAKTAECGKVPVEDEK